jgi:hypothetical protein
MCEHDAALRREIFGRNRPALRASEGVETPPTIMLRSAGLQQLETLSSHWGCRFRFTAS